MHFKIEKFKKLWESLLSTLSVLAPKVFAWTDRADHSQVLVNRLGWCLCCYNFVVFEFWR